MKFFVTTKNQSWGFGSTLTEALTNALIVPQTHFSIACEQLESLWSDEITSPPDHIKKALDEVSSYIHDYHRFKPRIVRVLPLQDGYNLDEVCQISGSATFNWNGAGDKPALAKPTFLAISETGVITLQQNQDGW